jgi:hypothetical protein
LVGLQPDIILAISFPVTIALQQETRTIPIVFANLMDGDIITSWLQQYAAVWAPALLAGVAPAIIAFFKGRSVMGWYLYGVACTVVAWPLIALPTVHALLVRPRVASPQNVSLEQRRAQALALFRSELDS